MAPSADGAASHGSGIALAAWVWPGFGGSDGIVFHSERQVRNLVQDECLHVGRDDQGRLCLEPGGGYSVARVVFEIEGVHVPFDLPWPDVTVSRRRAEGSVAPLPLGTRLSVGEDDRFDTISIRCPDQNAQLIIRGRREERPFYGGLTRSLAVRDLLAPASDERVFLQRGNGSEVLLFELVAALAPQAINLLPARSAIRLQLKFGEPVDAVAVEVEDETGAVVFAEAALRHRPVATRRPDWFHAEVSDNDAHGLELTLNTDWLDDGPCLARLLIRPEGRDGWRPLRNSRGDSFAVAIAKPGRRRIRAGRRASASVRGSQPLAVGLLRSRVLANAGAHIGATLAGTRLSAARTSWWRWSADASGLLAASRPRGTRLGADPPPSEVRSGSIRCSAAGIRCSGGVR